MEKAELEINQIVYRASKNSKGEYSVKELKVTKITKHELGHYTYDFDNQFNSIFTRNIGKQIFKTKKEAENKLDLMMKIDRKRLLLKQYEDELNKAFGIENHYLIKLLKGE